MKPLYPIAALFTVMLLSPSLAAEDVCDECPRVQLLREQNEIRIAAQDDQDPYESLQHRVRFVTADGMSSWTAWGDTNAYSLATGTAGRVEAETIDLEGNVGRGVIRIVAPTDDDGSRGPEVVQEDSSTEAQWNDDSRTSDGTTVDDLADEEPPPTSSADEWLSAGEWDHTVCPVASAEIEDAGSACSTAKGELNHGLVAALLAFGAVLLGRVRRAL